MKIKNVSGDKCALQLTVLVGLYGHKLTNKELENIRALMAANSSFLVNIGAAGLDITVVNIRHARLYENVKQRVKCGAVLFFQGHKMNTLTPGNIALNRGYFSGQMPTFQTPGAMENVRHDRPRKGAYEDAIEKRPKRRRCTGGGYQKTLQANTVQQIMHLGVL